MTRPLRDEEIEIIKRIAKMLESTLKNQLLADLKAARAMIAHPDGSIIRFELENYARPSFEGQRPYPFEMKVRDKNWTSFCLLTKTAGSTSWNIFATAMDQFWVQIGQP